MRASSHPAPVFVMCRARHRDCPPYHTQLLKIGQRYHRVVNITIMIFLAGSNNCYCERRYLLLSEYQYTVY